MKSDITPRFKCNQFMELKVNNLHLEDISINRVRAVLCYKHDRATPWPNGSTTLEALEGYNPTRDVRWSC